MEIGKIRPVVSLVAAGFTLAGVNLARAGALVTEVQSASHNNNVPLSDLPTSTAVFPSNNTAGNLIVVAVNLGASVAAKRPVIHDTLGNSYFPATSQLDWTTNGGGSSAQLFYAPNIKGGANAVTMTTVTLAGTSGNAFNQIAVHEYAGVALAAPLDVSAGATAMATNSPCLLTSGPATTEVDGELIFGYGNVLHGPLSAGAGFTLRESFDGITEDRLQTNAGPVAATEIDNTNNDQCVMLMATFRPAAALQPLELPVPANWDVNEQDTLVVTNTAAEVAAAPATMQTTLFTYPDRAALASDGWSFIATRADGSARDTEATNGPGRITFAGTNSELGVVMGIPCDVGDLWAAANNTTNSLFRALPTNWVSARLSLAFSPTLDLQQAHLGIFQDDDNYVEMGLGFNDSLGGEVVEAAAESAGDPAHLYTDVYWLTGGPGTPPPGTMLLRLDRNPATDAIAGFCSLDGVAWTFIGEYSQSLVNPRLGIWVGGSPVPYTNGLPVCDVRELDVFTAPPPPGLQYQLLNPPAGAVIDGSGVITWTPATGQGGTAYALTTVVQDVANGLSATNSFLVTVARPTAQPSPQILTVNLAAGVVVITWSTISGKSYTLQFADNLNQTNWQTAAVLTATTNTAGATNSPGNSPRRFYRVWVAP
jgi:hypothetical protein